MRIPDYAEFKVTLKKAVALHFAALAKTFADDRCNGYCLYTNDEVSSIGPVANRASALKVKLGEADYNYYRFNPDEWSEWNDLGQFGQVADFIRQYAAETDYFRVIAPKLLSLCVDTLVEMKAEGVFNPCSDDLFLVVWIPDSNNRVMQESAARLNSPLAYGAFAREFCGSQ